MEGSEAKWERSLNGSEANWERGVSGSGSKVRVALAPALGRTPFALLTVASNQHQERSGPRKRIDMKLPGSGWMRLRSRSS